MTSLAKQLRDIAQPALITPRQVDSRWQPSFLFEGRSAAEIDRETVLALSKNGFEELVSLDSSFTEFQRLFKASYLERDRGMLTADENGKLNALLNKFLVRLSPYLLLRPTQKLFEWLITIHKVHYYNLRSLLECVLPYYNTNLFVRMVQLLPLADRSSEWHWLKPVQKSNMPLSSLSLTQHALSTPSFLSFLCQLFLDAVPSPEQRPFSHSSTNFYISTLVQVIRKERGLRENLVQILLPSLTEALRSQAEDMVAAGLILTSFLATNCILSSELCAPIVKMVCRTAVSLPREAIGCLAMLADTQPDFSFTKKCIKLLAKSKNYIDTLLELDSTFKIDKLPISLLRFFIDQCVQSNNEQIENALSILKSVQFCPDSIKQIFRHITDSYISVMEAADSECRQAHAPLVEFGRVLAHRFPSSVREVLEVEQHGRQENGINCNGFVEQYVLSVYLSGNECRGLPFETSLFLSLNHASAETRLAAVLRIGQQVSASGVGGSAGFLRASLSERIRDEEAQVVLAVLEIGASLFQIFPPQSLVEMLLDVCSAALARVQSKPWRLCLLASLQLVCSEKSLAAAPHIINPTSLLLLDLLQLRAPTLKFSLLLSKVLTQLALTQHQALFKGIPEFISENDVGDFDKDSPVELLVSYNETLLGLFSRNLLTLEATSLECFVDFLFNSLKDHKYMVTSMCLISLVLSYLSKEREQIFYSLAADFIKIFIDSDVLFDIISSDYGNAEKLTSKLGTVITDPTLNPKSDFVSRQAVSRLSAWTFSSIVSRYQVSTSSDYNFFWKEDLSDVGLDVKFTFSLLSLLIELDLSKSSLRPAYEEVIQQLLAVLNESVTLSAYVSNLLTLPAAATDLHRNLTPDMRVYSLCLLSSFVLSLLAAKDSSELIGNTTLETCIFPALLFQLLSPNKHMRRVSLKCLQSINTNSQQEHPYRSLVSSILDRSTDILTSPGFSRLVLSNIGSGRIQVGKRRSKRLSQTSAPFPFDPIFSLLTGNSTPNHILPFLLSILECIDSEQTYETVCAVLDKSLQQPEQFGAYHEEIMNKIFNVFTPTLAPLISEDSQAVKLISRFLNSNFAHLHTDLIIKLTPDFFQRLPYQTQVMITSLLFNIIIDETDKFLDSTVTSTRETLSKYTLDSTHISYILKQNLGIELRQTEATVNCFPVRKKRKPGRSSTEHTIVSKLNDTALSRIFEVLLKCQLSALDLFPMYFHILSLLQHSEESGDSPSLDYNNNLLLSLMTKALQTVSPSKLPRFEPSFDVLQIIRTIQGSPDVQVQVQGYILLSEAAKLMPDRIIHSIMPIFTFMGTNLARNDDGYSFQVIIQATEALVPPLVNVEGVNQPVLSLVRAVLQVFVDAYPHIPSHRRTTLFVHLVNVIGASQSLYLLVILLILRDGKNETSKMRAFARTLLTNFELETQLSSFVDMMGFLDCIIAGSEETGSENGAAVPDKTGILEDLAPQLVRDLSVQIIEFQSNYIVNKHFVKKLSFARNGSADVDTYFVSMIEKGLAHIEKTVNEELELVELDFLSYSLAYLGTEHLVGFFKQISDQFESRAVDKLLELLYRRLDAWNESGELESLTQLVELSSFLLKWSNSEHNTVAGRQSALKSLALIVHVVGPSCVDTMHKPVRRLLKSITGNDGDCVVLGEQLLLLSEFVVILKIQFVPHLPQLIPGLIQIFRSLPGGVADDSTAYGCLSVFKQLLQHISNFLNPYLPDLLSISVADQSNRSDRVSFMLERMRSSIGCEVSFRIILSNVQKVMTDLEASEPSITQLSHLLSILEESLIHVQKSDLAASHCSLHELLLQTLDFRSVHSGESESKISVIEEACAGVYINFVLKLSERSFKSLYLQLREWGTSEESPRERLIPFYVLSSKLANKLKSIFSIYLIYFIENVVELLDRTHLKTETEHQLHNDPNGACLLLTNVFNCLENCLKFDQEHILTREYFDLLKQPLISQLTNGLGGKEEFQDRITTHFIPCLLQFAARAEQDGMWKEITLEVLIISKSPSPRVRFAALLALDALFRHLGSEYLQVLPDAVPYLAELLEDESVEVEQQCQVVIATIEAILGDSIQQYF